MPPPPPAHLADRDRRDRQDEHGRAERELAPAAALDLDRPAGDSAAAPSPLRARPDRLRATRVRSGGAITAVAPASGAIRVGSASSGVAAPVATLPRAVDARSPAAAASAARPRSPALG